MKLDTEEIMITLYADVLQLIHTHEDSKADWKPDNSLTAWLPKFK